MQRKFTLLFALQFIFLIGIAQIPSLKITGGQDSCVSLRTLKIDIKVAGTISSTSMEMTFQNCTNRILEGTLTFPLPEGVTVSGYALDINGKMREAVPVEKEKATQVFESIERRRVDPGLLEKVEGNNFRTRIYPLPAGGSRTVRISYNEVLSPGANNTLRYTLPLVHTEAIPDFHLSINVLQSSTAPVLEEQPGDLQFKEWNRNYTATMDKKYFVPLGVLRFAIPRNTDTPEAVMQKVNNDYYFMASLVVDQPQPRKRVVAKKIGIIWDASISGLKRNTAAEFELLKKYFEQNTDCTVELATLTNSFEKKGSFSVVNGNWQNLKKTLEAITYDGATNLAAINLLSIQGDEYFLFSDGLSTFGASSFPFHNKKIFTINSSQQADYSVLQLIARNSGATFINLAAQTPADGIKNLREESFGFIRVKNNQFLSEIYPSSPVSINNGCFSITGLSSLPMESITMQFGYGNTVTLEKTISLNYSKQQTSQVNLQRFWAEQKIAELDLQYEKYKNEIGSLGRQYSIVTRNTSLMVLETIDDYIRYKIEPPAEMKKEYYTILKQQRDEENEVEEIAYDITSSFKGLYKWWNPVVSKPIAKKFTSPEVVADAEVSVSNLNGSAAMDSAVPTIVEANKGVLEEVVVTAYGQQRQQRELGYSTSTVKSEELSGKVAGLNVTMNSMSEVVVTGFNYTNTPAATITVADWTPDRPYLTAIEREEPGNYYSKYIDMREDFISTPTFYFDMAGFFFRKKDKQTALKVLSNIAELNIEDHELYVMLGFKLKEAGDTKNALYVFKKVLDWRPHEPQSYRHYALALADAGKWQQAADMLHAGLVKKYPQDIIDCYEGIQDVMIMELNNLLTQHKDQIKTGLYNKKIIAVMPVDIRVVLNWNRNDTDIDLWVTDPKGEKCYYGNTQTSSGALISADMVSGYGPEQLMVRKALKGKYKIEVNYFGDSQVKLTGPSTIMAEIFTRYNTGKQERKIITLQMQTEEEKDGIFVGEFNFE